MEASEGYVAPGGLAEHGILEAIDAGLDDAVDLGGWPVEEGRHEVEFGEGGRKEGAGIPDGALFHFRLVDHAVILPGQRGAPLEAAHRAEAVLGVAVAAEFMGVAEAPGLATAERARR